MVKVDVSRGQKPAGGRVVVEGERWGEVDVAAKIRFNDKGTHQYFT
jgi:hypothetical protein